MLRFALLGKKLSHSFSPLIHNKLFKLNNIDANYSLLEISEDEIEDTLNMLRNGEYTGFNVTIPYKIKVMEYLDEISKEALEIGSVNTIVNENGRLIGYNTDYYGFRDELGFYNIDVLGKNAYVLGTGGASLAVSKVLKDLGAKVIVVSRNPIDGEISYDELKRKSGGVLINTTPVGMYPNVDESPLSKDCASGFDVVVDIIFNPLKTKLMTYNRLSFNGLAMLVFQAVKAQMLWFDSRIIVDQNEILKYVEGVLYE